MKKFWARINRPLVITPWIFWFIASQGWLAGFALGYLIWGMKLK